MSSTRYSSKNASVGKQGALADKRMEPREEQERLQLSVAAQVDASAVLTEVAEVQHGQELRPSVSQEIQGKKDYDWTRSTKVGPDRRFGETLAQQERRVADEAELERQREMARDADEAGLERARSCRVQCAAKTPYQRSTSDDRPMVDGGEREDPREYLDRETLATVNQAAAELDQVLGRGVQLGRPGLAKCIARRVRNGTEPAFARMDVERSLRSLPDVAEPLADVSAFTWRTTIEGTVVRLYEVPATNQFQAGTIRDADGTERKFVYWQKTKRAHGMPTFRVGDEVRLECVAVNAWQGAVSFALTGETDVIFDERGAGPSHCAGAYSHQPRIAPWDVDADNHGWVNDVDVDRAVELLGEG